jgi:hypothetical protein
VRDLLLHDSPRHAPLRPDQTSGCVATVTVGSSGDSPETSFAVTVISSCHDSESAHQPTSPSSSSSRQGPRTQPFPAGGGAGVEVGVGWVGVRECWHYLGCPGSTHTSPAQVVPAQARAAHNQHCLVAGWTLPPPSPNSKINSTATAGRYVLHEALIKRCVLQWTAETDMFYHMCLETGHICGSVSGSSTSSMIG